MNKTPRHLWTLFEIRRISSSSTLTLLLPSGADPGFQGSDWIILRRDLMLTTSDVLRFKQNQAYWINPKVTMPDPFVKDVGCRDHVLIDGDLVLSDILIALGKDPKPSRYAVRHEGTLRAVHWSPADHCWHMAEEFSWNSKNPSCD